MTGPPVESYPSIYELGRVAAELCVAFLACSLPQLCARLRTEQFRQSDHDQYPPLRLMDFLEAQSWGLLSVSWVVAILYTLNGPSSSEAGRIVIVLTCFGAVWLGTNLTMPTFTRDSIGKLLSVDEDNDSEGQGALDSSAQELLALKRRKYNDYVVISKLWNALAIAMFLATFLKLRV